MSGAEAKGSRRAAVPEDELPLLLPTGEFVATDLKVLLNVTGSQAAPAHHIAVHGE